MLQATNGAIKREISASHYYIYYPVKHLVIVYDREDKRGLVKPFSIAGTIEFTILPAKSSRKNDNIPSKSFLRYKGSTNKLRKSYEICLLYDFQETFLSNSNPKFSKFNFRVQYELW